MPRFDDVLPRDIRRSLTVHIVPPIGDRFSVQIEFYPNRLTQSAIDYDILDEGESLDDLDENEIAMRNNAHSLCDVLASWDMEGPFTSRKGTLLVEHGQPVPIRPEIVREAATWFQNQIIDAIRDSVFPNRTRGGRSRSR